MYLSRNDDTSEETDGTSLKTGFMAVIVPDSNIKIFKGHIIKFDRVVTNIGNCFSKITGVFTAPEEGEYQFEASFITGSYGRNFTHINLMKNNQVICRAFGTYYAKHATSSLQAVLKLKKGDKVYLKNNSKKKVSYVWGNMNSMFSGHMV